MKKLPLIITLFIMTVLFTIGCNMAPSKSAYLTAEATLCIGCGACTKVCKGDAIIIINNKAIIDPNKCIQCGQCVKVCPYDAIH